MARILATVNISLDGVMQSPDRGDEDTRGGFAEGGWIQRGVDETVVEYIGECMTREGVILMGRRTYEHVMDFWSTQEPDSPVTAFLLASQKYVATRDPDASFDYPNSHALVGNAESTVAALREQVEGTISVHGSGQLVRSLHAAGLIDAYTLLIHPLVLGSGTRLFGAGERTDLMLENSLVSSTGVIIASYSVSR